MSGYGGFIFILDEFQRAGNIEFRLERDRTFTDAISISDWHTKQAEIFLISFDDRTISHMALARRGNRGATQKRLIRFSNFIEFEPHISYAEIQENLGSRFQSHFSYSFKGIGHRIPPKTWQNVISVIKQIRPDKASDIRRLELLGEKAPEYLRRVSAETIVEERDAVNLALRMADFDPHEILEWNYPKTTNCLHFFKDWIR